MFNIRWDTKLEKEIIKRLGGKPRTSYGYDGIINGKPVEVRAINKDDRFRIQKDVHETLIRLKGSYIFCAEGHKPKKVLASKVSKILGQGNWFKDRKYPHRYVYKNEVFD